MSNINCVFVVDDDPASRNGISRLLCIAGYDVHAFASVDQFLEALSGEVCGCVVIDSRMPGLTGKELKEALTSRGVRLSTIVVTADDTAETRRKAKEMEAVGFFRKPVDGTALIDTINWVLKY
jgi:FixJ family two-component response regulator